MIVKGMGSMPSSKQPTENAGVDPEAYSPAGAVTPTNAPATVTVVPPTTVTPQ